MESRCNFVSSHAFERALIALEQIGFEFIVDTGIKSLYIIQM